MSKFWTTPSSWPRPIPNYTPLAQALLKVGAATVLDWRDTDVIAEPRRVPDSKATVLDRVEVHDVLSRLAPDSYRAQRTFERGTGRSDWQISADQMLEARSLQTAANETARLSICRVRQAQERLIGDLSAGKVRAACLRAPAELSVVLPGSFAVLSADKYFSACRMPAGAADALLTDAPIYILSADLALHYPPGPGLLSGVLTEGLFGSLSTFWTSPSSLDLGEVASGRDGAGDGAMDENAKATADDIGLTRENTHEARAISDGEGGSGPRGEGGRNIVKALQAEFGDDLGRTNRDWDRALKAVDTWRKENKGARLTKDWRRSIVRIWAPKRLK